ncbi:MAG: hypothetical protein ACTSRB_11085 [Candidatus Helarchaeota archaeon]
MINNWRINVLHPEKATKSKKSDEEDYKYLAIVKKGMKRIKEVKKKYVEELRTYNELLKENKNLFLRPTYVNRGKKVYYYWYRYIWDPIKKKTIQVYVGKRKLNEDEDLPDPPQYPLKDLEFETLDNKEDIVISREDYYKFKELFEGLEVSFNVKELIKSDRIPLI